MSNQTNSFQSPLSDEIVKNIDQLDLPIIKKHHVRLLAHCLEVLKEIGKDANSRLEEDELLKKCCKKQSQKFNDKNFKELDLEDLITLVEQNQEN